MKNQSTGASKIFYEIPLWIHGTYLDCFILLYCRSDGEISGIIRDQRCLQCMIQVGLARPYGSDDVIILV